MTNQQIYQIEQSYRNGDCMVFQIGKRVFVAETVLKHRKNATIEFQDCQEVDETCFGENGEYDGDVLDEVKNFILEDPCADEPNCVASIYYDDEVKKEW